jgi:hypothetical protein
VPDEPQPSSPGSLPPHTQPPAGTKPLPLGRDVPENEALRRARVIRGGVGAIPAVWEDE